MAGAGTPAPPEPVEQGDHGNTMVYSAAARVQEPLRQERAAVAAVRAPRAFVVAEGKRMPVPAAGAVIGRSRECDIVLADANVSRRHAEFRWAASDGLDRRRPRAPRTASASTAVASRVPPW